jgi:hypothetical protein
MHEKWYLKFRSDFLDQVKTLITENIEKEEKPFGMFHVTAIRKNE